ncbi:TIGR01457 family HAD-type hydrolase [Brevibacillus parabrevis]|uniref:Acid sugar phosphatase n=1 Tax=Brevibacillus parabrevis TaxID=54914 RepID=A0A4Y3PMM1_BREPA|nr:TIGR01457 family HAD-type hydrolase [Brevibacillus parabrevis]RNB94956.1 TIGR01457 family HAD-type hydrolase [Brevibacillus parabrevis]GEB34567.1 acid sugar phosphatase [Brevibacillus parabrevis]
MKPYKGYLLDLDGTIYRGHEAIPGAGEFVRYLQDKQIPYLFLTNNSSTSAERVADRLTGMGIEATARDVYTTSMATVQYLQEQAPAGANVYAIGEEGLLTQLEAAGYRLTEADPDYVIVGIDRAFTYEKLAVAARAIRSGATFIATNADAALPTDAGLFPGNGSLVAAVSVASATKPIVIGKPESIIVRYALEVLGTKASETLIVGDNLFTDIEAGANSGLDSLLVLTGYSTREEAASHTAKPTYVASDLPEWQLRISL